MAADDRRADGAAARNAERAARREFGNVGLVKEVTRDMSGWGWLDRLTQDLRYGARTVLRPLDVDSPTGSSP